jgi:hypothetical protein
VAVVLPLVGGALGGLHWMLVPSIVLVMGGFIWLLAAVFSLSPSDVLKGAFAVLMFVPMLTAPLSAIDASRELVLQARGVSRPAVITQIEVHQGSKGTTYDCTVRYDDSAKPVDDVIPCGKNDGTGDHVKVVRDPGGLVDPQFDSAVQDARFDTTRAVASDGFLMVISLSAVAIGAVIHLVHRRRAAAGGEAQPHELKGSSTH